MKNKPLIYGLVGGLAVLLYFKFGTKKAPTRLSADIRKDIPKEIGKINPIRIAVDPNTGKPIKAINPINCFRAPCIGDPIVVGHGFPVQLGDQIIGQTDNNRGLIAMQ